MALILESSTPTTGDIDVYINTSIKVTLSLAINSDTLHQGTVNLIDTATSIALPCSIVQDPLNPAKFIISPSVYLKQNTLYRVIIVGSDQGLGLQLEAADGNVVEETIYIEFTTGESVYSIDTTIEKDAADKSLEGDLFLPSNLKALGYDFTVTKMRPKNHSWDVAQSLTGDYTVIFSFSKTLLSGQDYTQWVDCDVQPILNNEIYLASGNVLDSTFTIPEYTVSTIDKDLIIQFNSELPKNTSIFIGLNKNITASDGTEYPGELEYSIVTQTLPKVAGPDVIRREIRPLSKMYNDDYISALLFKNSIWLWEKLGRALDITSFTHAARQYVIYSTILDLIEDTDLSIWVKSGSSKRLGDFSVDFQSYLGRISMKAAKYQKLKDIAFESLIKGWQFRVGTSSVAYEEAVAELSRLWYSVNNRYTSPEYKFYQDDIPATNVDINRWAKTNNPWW